MSGYYACVDIINDLEDRKLLVLCALTVRVMEFSNRGGTKLERFLPKNQHTVFPLIVSVETILF